MRKFIILVCLVQGLSLVTKAQVNGPQPISKQKQLSSWNGLYLKFRLSDKLFYYHEAHYRRTSNLGEGIPFVDRMFAVYNRFGLTYLFNKNLELTAGPVLVRNWRENYKDNDPEFAKEDYFVSTWQYRFWHQWMLIMPQMGRTKIYHQFRFEQRWRREGFRKDQTKYLFSNRWRYKAFAYIPINKPYIGEKTIYFSPSAEIFIQTGEHHTLNPLEDFRIYNVVGYIYNNRFTFSAGHMYTIGQRSSGWEYLERHIIRLNFLVNLDFRKKSAKLPPVRFED